MTTVKSQFKRMNKFLIEHTLAKLKTPDSRGIFSI